MGELLDVKGKRIYVEEHGEKDLPPLLYLHGGPGSSCYDFMHVQAGRLRKHLHLIGLDQRGVLRSDPIDENQGLSPLDLVEDAEGVRKLLNIQSWSILGHSFGGYLATLYGKKYPQSIDKIIYESPGFNFSFTLRTLFKESSKIFERENRIKDSEETMEYVTGEYEASFLMEKWLDVGRRLGKKREELYFHRPENDIFNQLFSEAPKNIQERLPQVQTHFAKLHENNTMYESLLNDTVTLPHPSLIIDGKFDHVFCEKQSSFIMERGPHINIVPFEQSGHFPRIEEPDRYAQTVIDFILN